MGQKIENQIREEGLSERKSLRDIAERGSISRGLKLYGEFLITMEYVNWKAREYARRGETDMAKESLEESREILEMINDLAWFEPIKGKILEEILIPLKKSKPHYVELIEIAKKRYGDVESQVEMILAGRLN